MKIDRLSISGFRCFGPEATVINLETCVTAFVGNNGSGKTAIFHALARLFGITASQRAVRKTDFHVAADETEVASGASLSIDCTLSFPELEADGEDDAVPEVFRQMSAAGEDEPLKVRIRLQAIWEEDATPEGVISEEVRWIHALDGDFEWEASPKVQASDRSLIQLVYVPASRNAFDQVTNLLKGRLWRAAEWSTELGDTAREGASRLQEQFDAEEPAAFIAARLEQRWNEVHQADTDTRPLLRLMDSRIDELVKRAEFVFFPDAAGQPRKLEDLSDGQRSLFHIALTAATLEIERDALAAAEEDSVFDQSKLKRTYLTLLAVEEPENSLSPFFLSRIMKQLRSIGSMTGAQVIVSSHSASILSRIEPEEVRYVRRDSDTRRSLVRRLTLPPDNTDARRYVRLAVRSYPELYFARFVILAEGESEAIVLPRIGEALGFPLDRSFVPIVPLGGRFVTHFWRLLSDLEIPYATLLDLDLGRAHGGVKAIKYVIQSLAEVGNDLSRNRSVRDGDVDLDDVDDIDEAELLEEDQNHPWLVALRRERVYFSSPIDLDFAMLCVFNDAYMRPREGGRGPRMDHASIQGKKATTLKTGGNPDLYGDTWDDRFAWYPYLFLGESKPDSHLGALTEISDEDLSEDAPEELIKLMRRVQRIVEG